MPHAQIPTNTNPYPDPNAGITPQQYLEDFTYGGATSPDQLTSTSAPASAHGGTSGQTSSTPSLDKIPTVEEINPLITEAKLKMRNIQ